MGIWEQSGRMKQDSEMKKQIFSVKDAKNNQFVLPPSGEEAMSCLVKNNIKSYKDLNKIFYQITWKFRNEIRPRHGVMRAKEFLMKDAYSFDINHDEALKT